MADNPEKKERKFSYAPLIFVGALLGIILLQSIGAFDRLGVTIFANEPQTAFNGAPAVNGDPGTAIEGAGTFAAGVPDSALIRYVYQGLNYLCLQINTPDHGFGEHYTTALPEASTASHIIRLIGDRGVPEPPFVFYLGDQVVPTQSLSSAEYSIFENTANGWKFCIKDNPHMLP